MADVLLVGHSHTQAIYGAMQARGEPVAWLPISVAPGESPIVVAGEGYRLRPDLETNLRGAIAPGTVCVSTVAGNAHNVLGLMAFDPPFDFRDPERPDLPLDPDARLVPYGSVRDSLAKTMAVGDMAMMHATCAAAPEIRIHVESPPPLRDGALITSLLDGYFVEKHPDAAVADPWLRLKLWRLHSRLFRETCALYGIEVLRPPAEAVDPDGFLRPDFSHPASSTHANAAYGALVADQIGALTS